MKVHLKVTAMPRVSVVVPVYNQPELVRDAVKSLQAQSLQDWEAILVDDGSTDDTPSVLGELAQEDLRVRVLTRSNGGAAAARNAGAATALSDWLLFLDSDDWLAPKALEALLQTAQKGAGVAHGLGLRVSGARSQDREQVRLPTGDLFLRLAWTATFMVHACLISRELFESVGGFEKDLRGCADWDLWQRVARTGATFRGVDEVVAYYRHTDASLSMNYVQELGDGLIVIGRGHGPDARVPNPSPDYAQGAPREEFPHAAYRFASWIAGVAISRGHSPREILVAMAGLPSASLSPSDIAAAFFDAIPIGLGNFRAGWAAVDPAIVEQCRSFAYDLSIKAGCGEDFADHVVAELERRFAVAEAREAVAIFGSAASCIVRIPGTIPFICLPRGVSRLIVVVKAGQETLGLLELPGSECQPDLVRDMVIERFMRAVALAYLKHSPGALARGFARGVFPLHRNPSGRSRSRKLVKRLLFETLAAERTVLPPRQGPVNGPSR